MNNTVNMGTGANEILVKLSVKYNGDWEEMYDAIKRKDELDEKTPNVLNEYITIIGDKYISMLKYMNKPPFVLYYVGDVDSVNNSHEKVCWIYEEEETEHSKAELELIEQLVKNGTVVASCSEGMIHRVMNCGGKFLLVSSKPIKDVDGEVVEYARANNCLIITEYPNTVGEGKGRTVVERCKQLCAGVCNKALVVSIWKENAGILSNVIHAGKDLYVFPKSPLKEREYNNELIKNGAFLCDCYKDILEGGRQEEEEE